MLKHLLMASMATGALACLLFAACNTVRASTHAANLELYEASISSRRSRMLLVAVLVLVILVISIG